MPCRVKKEVLLGPVGLEPLAGARIRRKREYPPNLEKNKGGGGAFVHLEHLTVLSQSFYLFILFLSSPNKGTFMFRKGFRPANYLINSLKPLF